MSYSQDWNKSAEYANKRWYEFFKDNEMTNNLLSNFKIKKEMKKNDLIDEIKENQYYLNYDEIEKTNIKNIISADWWYAFSEIKYNTEICFIKFWLYHFDLEKYNKLNEQEYFTSKEYNSIWFSEVCWFPYPSKNLKIKDFNKKETLNYILKEFLEKEDLFSTVEYLFNEKYNLESKEKYTKEEILEKLWFLYSKDVNQELSYILAVFEQLLIFKKIIFYYNNDIVKLNETLFIRDWFLWFVWWNWNILLEKVEKFISHLISNKIEFYLIWIEKSWKFVNFANHLENINLLEKDTCLLTNNDFVSTNILFDDFYSKKTYVDWKYYAGKVIVKIWKNKFVLNVPMNDLDNLNNKTNISDYNNLFKIIKILKSLKTFYYENWIIPIIMINKDVSISQSNDKILKDITLNQIN